MAGAAVGALTGAAIFAALFNHANGIAIIQTGRAGGLESGHSSISRAAPVTLAERMQATAFAKRIAERVGVDPVDLASPQYGGNGMLRVRLIGDGTLIEITSRAADPETALKIVATAADLAVADDRAMMAPLRAMIASRIAELTRQRADIESLANAMAARNLNPANYPEISAISEGLAKNRVVSELLWEAQSGAVAPASQDAAVIAQAALSKPVLAHWWQAVLLGMFAAASIGFMAGIFLRGAAGAKVDRQMSLVPSATNARSNLATVIGTAVSPAE